MGLTADECRMLEDGNVAIWFKGIYDRYTQYRRDHAILGECLPYGQFMKQLRKSDLYVCDRTVMLGDNRRKGTILDYLELRGKHFRSRMRARTRAYIGEPLHRTVTTRNSYGRRLWQNEILWPRSCGC